MKISEAIQALEELSVSKTDNMEASMLLMSLPVNRINEELFRQVRGPNDQWIQTAPLKETAIRLLSLSIFKPSEINGAVTGYFLKRLISSEIEIGGPYGDGDFMTNAAIAQFLLNLNIKLPNLINFLKKEGDKKQNYATLIDQWSVSWPHKIYSFKHFESDQDESIYNISATICLHKNTSSSSSSIQNPVHLQVKATILELDSPLHISALNSWKIISRADKHKEISFISRYIEQSLNPKLRVSKKSLQLGVANFYAWMAYSIYDDFLDDEGDPSSLSIANIMHRLSLLKYLSLAKGEEVLITNAYALVDSANAWEIENCRFQINNFNINISKIPDFKDGQILAERAFGHILGPLLITRKLTLNKRQDLSIHSGLKHYLIARQLNDDIHDWKEDLEAGHITYVVAFLLKRTNTKLGEQALSDLIVKLENYFWESGLDEISVVIMDHINRCLENFKSTSMFNLEGPFFKEVISPMKSGTQKGIDALKDRKTFLKVYSS